jgi:hypothetical protein
MPLLGFDPMQYDLWAIDAYGGAHSAFERQDWKPNAMGRTGIWDISGSTSGPEEQVYRDPQAALKAGVVHQGRAAAQAEAKRLRDTAAASAPAVSTAQDVSALKTSQQPFSQNVFGSSAGASTASGAGAPGATQSPEAQALFNQFGQPEDLTRSVAAAKGFQLSPNLQLPPSPTTAFTDDVFEASRASLLHDTTKNYADVLRQLGFTNPYEDPTVQGDEFIMGSVETGAARQQSDIERNRDLALQGVDEQFQRGDSYFSGRRAVRRGEAETPYNTGLARLKTDTATQLGNLYTQAQELLSNFALQQDQLLAAASQRQAEAIRNRPVGATPTPPADETAPKAETAPTTTSKTPPALSRDEIQGIYQASREAVRKMRMQGMDWPEIMKTQDYNDYYKFRDMWFQAGGIPTPETGGVAYDFGLARTRAA